MQSFTLTRSIKCGICGMSLVVAAEAVAPFFHTPCQHQSWLSGCTRLDELARRDDIPERHAPNPNRQMDSITISTSSGALSLSPMPWSRTP